MCPHSPGIEGSSLLSKLSNGTFVVTVMSAAAVFGAVCGLGLLVFLAVIRGRRSESVTAHRNTMAAVMLLVTLTRFAMSLQAYSFNAAIGAPRTETLNDLQVRQSLTYVDIGGGSAGATILGILLGVLGLSAVLVALTSGLRIHLTPAERGPEP